MPQPIHVFGLAGQSNADGTALTAPVGPLSRISQAYRTHASEWEGRPAYSYDSGRAYDFPTLATAPGLYSDCQSGGIDTVVDNFGPYDKNNPLATIASFLFTGTTGGTYTIAYGGNTTGPVAYSSNVATLMANVKAAIEALPGISAGDVLPSIYVAQFAWSPIGTQAHSTSIPTVVSIAGLTGPSPALTIQARSTYGTFADESRFGPELAFLARYREEHPGVTLCCIKNVLGGSNISSWCPMELNVGTLQAASGLTITLASADFVAAAGRRVSINVGTSTNVTSSSVSYATILTYDSGTKVATVDAWSGRDPVVGDSYGIERQQFAVMRIHYQLMIARLATYGVPVLWKGWLWYQGESGSQNSSTDDTLYLASFRALRDSVRRMTSTPDLPMIVARISDIWLDTRSLIGSLTNGWSVPGSAPATIAACLSARIGVNTRRASEVTLGSEPNCCWYSNDGWPARALDLDEFFYHNPPNGALTGGERAYSAYKAKFGPRGSATINAGGSKLTISSR